MYLRFKHTRWSRWPQCAFRCQPSAQHIPVPVHHGPYAAGHTAASTKLLMLNHYSALLTLTPDVLQLLRHNFQLLRNLLQLQQLLRMAGLHILQQLRMAGLHFLQLLLLPGLQFLHGLLKKTQHCIQLPTSSSTTCVRACAHAVVIEARVVRCVLPSQAALLAIPEASIPNAQSKRLVQGTWIPARFLRTRKAEGEGGLASAWRGLRNFCRAASSYLEHHCASVRRTRQPLLSSAGAVAR